jgi:hypothetical protein
VVFASLSVLSGRLISRCPASSEGANILEVDSLIDGNRRLIILVRIALLISDYSPIIHLQQWILGGNQ